jgi:hypothetical protein
VSYSMETSRSVVMIAAHGVRHVILGNSLGIKFRQPESFGLSILCCSSKEISIMSKQNGSPAKAPVHEVRLGRIKAAVWENTTENGVRHNVTISRLYKDGTQWKDSASFGRDDLPLVIKVADQAHSWIFNQSGSEA